MERDPRWAAVLRRDASRDGSFVYAVTTTGVFCRPSCPARRPKPTNVRLFSTPAEARTAGFRACKRCRPEARGEAADDPQRAVILAACAAIDASESAPSVGELAAAAGVSESTLHRAFKAALGLTPRAFVAARREQRLRGDLADAPSVTAALYDAGFASSAGFYARAKAILGMRPATYRAGGEAETIRFAVGPCSLGAVLVAGTAAGICAIDLGDDPQRLVEHLERRFDRAELIGADATFEAWVARVVALVDGASDDARDLPLDVRGTAFQRRVWTALAAIPAGTTTTYAALAEALGQPKAARAVARACAANPVALAIPCHRVVRRDGGLAGYRWGVERKRALLEREQARDAAPRDPEPEAPGVP
ncbi:MAG: bifunctional DNA-binding transcriptional regulator/O6-methylguanine-DNA methyltransferase Ada [Myxococcales bacterium]|nr:bifunctional DNA-binding transcriptional regulator/O6-methylguanine-DNA methyltransferase Ada [Myxococcales bacterium]